MILQQPLGIPPAASFIPTDISGCKVWIKADSLVLSNNDPVATWADQSGSSNDYLQATAGNKPLYKTNIINGLPAVLFDGTDDFMSTASNPNAQPLSAFVVTQPTLNTASQKTYATIAANSGTAFFMCAKISTNFWGTFTNGTGDLSSTNALVSGTNYLLETTNEAGGPSTFLYQKGVQVATRAESQVGTGTVGGLGKDLTNANRQYAGYIAEMVIYNTVLSSGNRANVENYLIAKWAL